MGREIDRRTFAGQRATPEREAALRSFAAQDSARLPQEHRVDVVQFDATTGNPAAVLSEAAPAATGNYVQRALDHVQAISATLGLTETQPAEFVADPRVQATSSGAAAVHLQQLYKGITIFQATQAVRFAPDGQLQETVGQSITVPVEYDATPALRVQEAVLHAARFVATPALDEAEETDEFGESLAPPAVDLGDFTPTVIATFPDKPDQPTVLAAGPFGDEIKANLIWFDLDGDLRLAWEVILTLPGYAAQYRTIVDADSGDILYCHQLIHHLTARANIYRIDGGSPREFVDLPLPLDAYDLPIPADLPPGFPGLWVDGETTEGNTVFAHLDDDGPLVGGTRQGDTLVFNPANPDGDAQRILNIFYLNCYIHNFFYLLGFRERDGNFQRDNFGRGGAPSDPVDARAYRVPVRGTATMYTPIDGTSPVMSMGLVSSTNRHTALDGGVVFHEYTHGVTNRLVGGALNTRSLDAIQSQGMGEGWSDYIACTITGSTVIGAWVVAKPGVGIRSAPYNSNYPGDFGQLGSDRYSSVHRIGEIWCAALLEMNRTLGKHLAVQLVMDALRLTPANPTFLQGRDAILRALDHKRAAGQLTPAQHGTARDGIWRAFAKFGMGPNARCDDSRTLTGAVPDFAPPPTAPLPPERPTPTTERVQVSATPNLPIPDADANGVRSTLHVVSNGAVETISVTIDIEHPFDSDLQLTLVSPTGKAALLHQANGDDGEDLQATFTNADTPALAALVGHQAHGDWTLHIADLAAEDVGLLQGWGLALEVGAAATNLAAVPEAPLVQDNLRAIKGIGPGVERRLHSAGISSYDQLAAMTAAEVAGAIGKVSISADRIERERWIEQARELAQQRPLAAPQTALVPTDRESATEQRALEAEVGGQQHYATFTIKLVLNEANDVHQTRITHVQNPEEGQGVWAGWDGERLMRFLADHAALRPTAAAAAATAEQPPQQPDPPPLAHQQVGNNLVIEVDELEVVEGDDSYANGMPAVADALHTEVQFRLFGSDAKAIIADSMPYAVQVLARDPENHTTLVLGAAQAALRPDTWEYRARVAFVPPEVGRYQLLGAVVLGGPAPLGVTVGPTLTVVP